MLIDIHQTDHDGFKKIISDYLNSIQISFQKGNTQAALHTYFYFITGNRFFKRLYVTDFDVDLSIEKEIKRFRKYLKEVAGLSDSTIISHCSSVKIFLYNSFQNNSFCPMKLNVYHVHNYFKNTLSHISPESKKTILVRIRSYVRFIQFTDGIELKEISHLPLIPPVWKRASMPKYLNPAELKQFFSAYDLNSLKGIRDYAIARCIKDLGLRCSEVANLSINDFDWLHGTVTIKKTKSHSERILPLPEVTGNSIETYLLRSRPSTKEKILFVRFKKEKGYLMGSSQIRTTIRNAAVRAKLERFSGVHMLRHTTAQEMINSGIDIKTIADILGHKSIETTSIYTKLNFAQLKDVAGKWPEVRA